MMYLRTRLVSELDFWKAYHETGGVYFIKDDHRDQVKIGYTRDPLKRISNLQVGSGSRLRFIGLVACEREIEKHVHQQFLEGRAMGEWFYDRGIITQWLSDMTQDEPLARHVWALVPGRDVIWHWDEDQQRHSKHYWDSERGCWDPPLPEGSW